MIILGPSPMEIIMNNGLIVRTRGWAGGEVADLLTQWQGHADSKKSNSAKDTSGNFFICRLTTRLFCLLGCSPPLSALPGIRPCDALIGPQSRT